VVESKLFRRECDVCGNTQTHAEFEIGTKFVGWLRVSQHGVGPLDFCSTACLERWVKRITASVVPEAIVDKFTAAEAAKEE